MNETFERINVSRKTHSVQTSVVAASLPLLDPPASFRADFKEGVWQ